MTKDLPAPEWFDPQKILANYLEGEGTEEIADSLGVSVEKLVYYLTTRTPEKWKEAVLIRALKRQIDAEDEIDHAKDLVELRRAETKLKSAQWNLERVCRRIYGQDVPKEPTEKVNIVLNIGTNNTAEKVVSEVKPNELTSGSGK
jgi:hypothetical protein